MLHVRCRARQPQYHGRRLVLSMPKLDANGVDCQVLTSPECLQSLQPLLDDDAQEAGRLDLKLKWHWILVNLCSCEVLAHVWVASDSAVQFCQPFVTDTTSQSAAR